MSGRKTGKALCKYSLFTIGIAKFQLRIDHVQAQSMITIRRYIHRFKKAAEVLLKLLLHTMTSEQKFMCTFDGAF